MALTVAIVTPERDVQNLECDEVIVPGAEGYLGILPQHMPLISVMKAGVLTTIEHARDHTIGLLMGTAEQSYAVGPGFFEVSEDRITILASTCEPIEEIDAERARRSYAQADELLGKLGPDDPGYGEALDRRERARARIETVSKGR